MSDWYNRTAEETLSEIKSRPQGLSAEEAAEREAEFGKNSLTEKKKKSVFVVFLSQFKDLLVVILIIAAIVSALTGGWESTAVILAVILMNAVLGTVQHVKAEKSLAALKALSMPVAKVRRSGEVCLIPSQDVVPGDVVLLEAGDLVVADGRILENYNIQVNESSLTGESVAAEKTDAVLNTPDPALGDRKNMVFGGSLVTYGRAVMAITETGMRSELGKIAALLNDTKERKTPLQQNLDKFGKWLALGILAICALVFGLTLWREWDPQAIFASLTSSLMFAVALAVAAIPEALASIVTIVQAVGTQKMAKQNAVIKDLKAVESLGSVSVICSDKTGTLTQNKMTVKEFFADGAQANAEALDRGNIVHEALLHAMIVVNDSTDTGGKPIGDPTELALTAVAQKKGLDEIAYRAAHPRTGELAFDSDRKLMSVRLREERGSTLFTKGAPDVLLSRVTRILTAEGARPITEADKKAAFACVEKLSADGRRLLAFACKPLSQETTLTHAEENGLTLLGMTAMIDPPREESAKAVADAKKAGIKPIMITGDHKATASAIARSLGILGKTDAALEGSELDRLSDADLDEILPKVAVYARVSPEHKIRIVDAWQRRGNIVAMTGDGVNDAPALKKADVGVAMGITGTEVSKDAADMILTDDNFATIVKSVVNGRGVYNNIRNAVAFLLSGNAAAILCILIASLAGWARPFEAVQLLFINLLTDSLPAIAIGMEPASDDLLRLPPRNPKEQLLNKRMLLLIAAQGALIGAATMGAFLVGNTKNAATAVTMAFLTLTLARLFHGFNCRGEKSIFGLGFRSNLFSLWAFLAGVALVICVALIPGVKTLFAVTALGAADFGYVALFAIAPTLIIQGYKIARDIRLRRAEARAKQIA